MAVASTPLVAAPSCPAWAKHRRGRQPQFDGKPCEPAEEEDMWLCLADGRTRSTADLKRLASVARNPSLLQNPAKVGTCLSFPQP